jgi:hypothetical protein
VLAAPIIALMMETASTSETLVNFYQTSRRNNPENSNLQIIFYLFNGVLSSSDYRPVA